MLSQNQVSTEIEDKINPKHHKDVLVIPRHRIPEFINEDGDLALQYMDVMSFVLTEEELEGHLKGQAFKYLLRLGKKDPKQQELGKADWYINYFIKFINKNKR